MRHFLTLSLEILIVVAKSAITAALSAIFGLSLANSAQTGLLLSQGGEFAFVAFGLAKVSGVMDPATSKLFLTSVAISMATTPSLASLGTKLANRLEEKVRYSEVTKLRAEHASSWIQRRASLSTSIREVGYQLVKPFSKP